MPLENYELIFRQLPEAAILTDLQCRIMACNALAEELLGNKGEDIKGKRIQVFLNSPLLINLLDEAVMFTRIPTLNHENSIIDLTIKDKKKYYKISMNLLNCRLRNPALFYTD